MGFSGGGGGVSIALGTNAAKPGVPATTFYWATDTKELLIANSGAWDSIGHTNSTSFTTRAGNGFGDSGNDMALISPNQNLVGFGAAHIRLADQLNINNIIKNSAAANEAAAATAGAGAAPPATVQGYLLFTDSAGTVRKIPYYAN